MESKFIGDEAEADDLLAYIEAMADDEEPDGEDDWEEIPDDDEPHGGGGAASLFSETVPVDEVALAGPDGKRAAELLGEAKAKGAKTLYYLARRAVKRLLADPNAATAAFLFDFFL